MNFLGEQQIRLSEVPTTSRKGEAYKLFAPNIREVLPHWLCRGATDSQRAVLQEFILEIRAREHAYRPFHKKVWYQIRQLKKRAWAAAGHSWDRLWNEGTWAHALSDAVDETADVISDAVDDTKGVIPSTVDGIRRQAVEATENIFESVSPVNSPRASSAGGAQSRSRS